MAPREFSGDRRLTLHMTSYFTAPALVLAIWLIPSSLAAHPAIEAQVEIVNERLEQEPRNASLFFKRGQLHQAHRAWNAAIADYERAAELDSGLHAARIRLSEVLLEAGRAGDAKRTLDVFLSEHDDHVDGLVLRSRINSRLSEFALVVADYDRAINRSTRPQPDWFLERARAAAQNDADINKAIEGLDEGLTRLGPLVTLQAMAIELELRRRGYEAALARVDQLLAPMPRQSKWLIKRAELLTLLGRRTEARVSYETALEVIKALPANRRSTKMIIELEKQAKESINMIDSTIQLSNAEKE